MRHLALTMMLATAPCLAVEIVDCNHLGDHVAQRAAAGEFKTHTEKALALIDDAMLCKVDMSGIMGKILARQLELAGKVDRGEMTGQEAATRIKFETKRWSDEDLAAMKESMRAHQQAVDSQPPKPTAAQQMLIGLSNGLAQAGKNLQEQQSKTINCTPNGMGGMRCTSY